MGSTKSTNEQIHRVDDLLSKLELQEKRQKYDYFFLTIKRALPFVTAIYAIVIALFFTINRDSLRSIPSILNYSENNKITKLEGEVENLSKKFDTLKRDISSSDSASDPYIRTQLKELQTNYSALSETILVDADKALTSRLLREKQVYLDDQINYLREEQAALRGTTINLILTLIAVPAITLIAPLIYQRLSLLGKKFSKKEV